MQATNKRNQAQNQNAEQEQTQQTRRRPDRLTMISPIAYPYENPVSRDTQATWHKLNCGLLTTLLIGSQRVRNHFQHNVKKVSRGRTEFWSGPEYPPRDQKLPESKSWLFPEFEPPAVEQMRSSP